MAASKSVQLTRPSLFVSRERTAALLNVQRPIGCFTQGFREELLKFLRGRGGYIVTWHGGCFLEWSRRKVRDRNESTREEIDRYI